MKFITEKELEFKKELKEMVRKYPSYLIKGTRKSPKHIVTLAAKIKMYDRYKQQLPSFKEEMEKETDQDKKAKMQERIGNLEERVNSIPELITKLNLYLVEYTQVNKNKKRLAKLKKKGYTKKRVPFKLGGK